MSGGVDTGPRLSRWHSWPDPADRGLRSWLRMGARIRDSRTIVVQLVHRDLRAQYRQSLLGWAWLVILPLITVAFFTFLVGRRVLPIGELAIPYPAFALWNVIIWQLFAGTLMACTQSLASAGPLVTRINFPKEAVIIAAAGKPLIEFAIKLAIVVPASMAFGVVPGWSALPAIFVLVPMLLLAIGIGFVFAVLNLVARDVEGVTGVIAGYGMLAGPILYPPPVTPPFDLVNTLNPFSPFLIAIQDLLIRGTVDDPQRLAGYVLLAATVFVGGWRFMYRVLPRALERA